MCLEVGRSEAWGKGKEPFSLFFKELKSVLVCVCVWFLFFFFMIIFIIL